MKWLLIITSTLFFTACGSESDLQEQIPSKTYEEERQALTIYQDQLVEFQETSNEIENNISDRDALEQAINNQNTGVNDSDIETFESSFDTDQTDFMEIKSNVTSYLGEVENALQALQSQPDKTSDLRELITDHESTLEAYQLFLNENISEIETALADDETYLNALNSQLLELQKKVEDADELLASLIQQVDSIVLIPGESGDQGEQGIQGEQGQAGSEGEGLTLEELETLQATVLSKRYVRQTIDPESFFNSKNSNFNGYQHRLQNLMNVLERIEVGESVDYETE